MRNVVLICHNLRSCHNVGSLLRTADGLGVTKVHLTGYTPYPLLNNDIRLPHISVKMDKQISKTALGAEKTQKWEHSENVVSIIQNLKTAGFTVAALEQTKDSQNIVSYVSPDKIALLVGRETLGVEPEVLKECDLTLEIPMQGAKESFNVVQAAAMALYHLVFHAG